jgi:hypothetical protein
MAAMANPTQMAILALREITNTWRNNSKVADFAVHILVIVTICHPSVTCAPIKSATNAVVHGGVAYPRVIRIMPAQRRVPLVSEVSNICEMVSGEMIDGSRGGRLTNYHEYHLGDIRKHGNKYKTCQVS